MRISHLKFSKKRILGVLIFTFSVGYLQSSQAVVDMKNAAYVDQFLDITLPGTAVYDLKVNRTYSSRFNFTGILGYGWCTDFETSIEKTAEGSLKLQICGAGQETVFVTGAQDLAMANKVVDQILERVKKEKPSSIATPKYLSDLKSQLLANAAQRLQLAKQVGISIPEVKKGAVYISETSETDKITFDGTFYVRSLTDGTMQKFDSNGRLSYMYDKNSNYLKLVYNGDLLKEVQDSANRKLNFIYKNKRVIEITGPSIASEKIRATYEYKGEDLVKVVNRWGNTYLFEYDDVHNLTKINFPDGTFKALSYDKKNAWVMSFTDRIPKGGVSCTETYAYEVDKNEPRDHFWSTAIKKCGKEITNQARFEFWHKKRMDGRKYLSRVLTKTNSESLDVTYHPDFGRPTTLKRNGSIINFSYYPNGLIHEKSTDSIHMNFEYKNSFNKVSKVTTEFYNSENRKLERKRDTNFTYDAKANLVAAANTDGQNVKLTYDAKGRIATIIDQAKKEVIITYDEKFSKPSVITRPKVGSINVTYKANGEIEKVGSKDGPSVATQVASAFNNLLELIAPATSELSL
jgi:YD repeat-containing protein